MISSMPMLHRARKHPATRKLTSSLAAISALACVLLGVVGVTAAQATPAVPHTSFTDYVRSSSTTTAFNMGYSEGQNDADFGEQDIVAVLDFGGQLSGATGTDTVNGISLSNSAIESIAEQFALGYFGGTGSDTTSTMLLSLGTNDSLYSVDSSGGSTWGGIVNAVASYAETNLKQVIVTGGDDIEPGFGTPASSAIAWANGFGGKSTYYYDDYGSADGCPQSSYNNSQGCENSWTQWDEWDVAYGLSPANVIPEIYNSQQGLQWTMISLYGADYKSTPIRFLGVMDEYDLDSSTYSTSASWNDLCNDLDSHSATAITPIYNTEIFDEG